MPAGLPASAAYILVDASTGRVIAQSNDAAPLSPASLSKMFTALVAAGWLPATATISASPRDTMVEPNKIGMMPGQMWSLSETLQALLIISANDAAYALAEKVAGSAEAFGPVVEQAMTQMGITDQPVFKDPAGFDDSMSIAGGNLINARDLAIAARDLLADPVLAPIVAEKHLAYTGPQGTVYDLANVNDFFLNTYSGAVGIKTGLTDKSGFSVAEAATRAGRTMIAIVLHGSNSPSSAMKLLDQGFSTPAATESTDGALPAVVLPTPPAAVPATTTSVPAPAATKPTLGHIAQQRAAAAPGGPSVTLLAPIAAVLLGLAALLVGRRYRRRRRPAHARRRRT